jgi:hypothetical protein
VVQEAIVYGIDTQYLLHTCTTSLSVLQITLTLSSLCAGREHAVTSKLGYLMDLGSRHAIPATAVCRATHRVFMSALSESSRQYSIWLQDSSPGLTTKDCVSRSV